MEKLLKEIFSGIDCRIEIEEEIVHVLTHSVVSGNVFNALARAGYGYAVGVVGNELNIGILKK